MRAGQICPLYFTKYILEYVEKGLYFSVTQPIFTYIFWLAADLLASQEGVISLDKFLIKFVKMYKFLL